MTTNDSITMDAINNIDWLDQRIDSLGDCLNNVDTNVESIRSIVETANDSISCQLSAASIFLTVVSIILGVLIVVLGWYIGKKKNEIEKIAETLDKKKKLMDSIEERTKDLDTKITNDVAGLYKKLHREETKALLYRLIEEPEDIANIANSLLARELEEEDYELLHKAYSLFKQQPNEKGDIAYMSVDEHLGYLILLFQHFCYHSIIDDDIRSELIKQFASVIECAFKRDIAKSTEELCQALSDNNVSFNKKELLVAYLKALNTTKFKNFAVLKDILEQKIMPKSLLEESKEQCKIDKVDLKLFDIESTKEKSDKNSQIL